MNQRNNHEHRLEFFAQNINKVTPVPGPNAQEIVALIKTGGRVTGYQLADGQKLDKQQAVALAKSGGIRGVAIAERQGNEYLRTLPDELGGNNLSNLPSIEG